MPIPPQIRASALAACRNPFIAILIVIAVLGIALPINLYGLHGSKIDLLPKHPSDETTSEKRPQTDYSSRENWAWFAEGKEKDADVFLVCPTVDVRDEYNMSLEDTKTKENFLGALNMERDIYEGSARLYAPYYRQAAMKVYSMDSRLVAVYAIGWPCTEELTRQYPQIRPACREDDTGVVISFDCEDPALKETMITPADVRANSINPLNWRTDGRAADPKSNPGSCFTDYSGEVLKEETGLCGCYIDEARGVLKVTGISSEDYPAVIPGLQEGAYHIYDYQFFFRALEKNVQTRVSRFSSQSVLHFSGTNSDKKQ